MTIFRKVECSGVFSFSPTNNLVMEMGPWFKVSSERRGAGNQISDTRIAGLAC